MSDAHAAEELARRLDQEADALETKTLWEMTIEQIALAGQCIPDDLREAAALLRKQEERIRELEGKQ